MSGLRPATYPLNRRSRFQPAPNATAAAIPPRPSLPRAWEPPPTTAARVSGLFFGLRALSGRLVASRATCGLLRPVSRRRAPLDTGELGTARPRAARRRAVHTGTSGSQARGRRGPGCGHSRTANTEVVAVFDHDVRAVGALRAHLQNELGLRLRQREDLDIRRNVGARRSQKLAAPAPNTRHGHKHY